MNRVTVIDTCTSTIEEIDAFRNHIDHYLTISPDGDTTLPVNVGLVSSPYHLRRIRIMAARRFGNRRIRLYTIAVPLEYYSWSPDAFHYWWRSGAVTPKTVNELVKIGYFFLTGYF